MSTVNATQEVNVNFQDMKEVKDLIRRQDDLEDEINRLKKLVNVSQEDNKKTIERVHKRIDGLEKEVADIRDAIDKIMLSMSTIQVSVTSMSEKVGEINAKQDITITAQDKFISQLWKAFFAVLGLVTAGVGAIITLLK